MNKLQLKVFLYGLLFLLFSCEEDVSISVPEGEERIVVQGHIEQNTSPYVVLTRSVPALSATDADSFTSSFVHDAIVTVKQGTQSVILQEYLFSNLPLSHRKLVSELFGFPVNSVSAPIYVYTSADLTGVPGKQYDLQIVVAEKTLSATTQIPAPTAIDSLWFVPETGAKNDSLVTLWYRYQDPDTLGNQVRYFTSRNAEPFYPGFPASVFNDEFVNGRTFTFPLERGRPKSYKVINNSTNLFRRGDTVRVKWSAIDFAHYQFWFTLEADRASNGNPLGFPTTVQSNISGGLGIWGGYGVTRHTVVAP